MQSCLNFDHIRLSRTTVRAWRRVRVQNCEPIRDVENGMSGSIAEFPRAVHLSYAPGSFGKISMKLLRDEASVL